MYSDKTVRKLNDTISIGAPIPFLFLTIPERLLQPLVVYVNIGYIISDFVKSDSPRLLHQQLVAHSANIALITVHHTPASVTC